MKWDYCIGLYLEKHCAARGLQPKTIVAYRDALNQFKEFMESTVARTSPEQVKTRDVLEYVEYIRQERHNKDSAVNRTVTIIRNFYRALVAMEYLDVKENPMAGFPKMKATRRKFRDTLTEQEVKRLIKAPRTDTVLGIRDRAILIILYGTGIRASECAELKEKDVHIEERIIHVTGKGGDQRTVPLNDDVARALKQYRSVRGEVSVNAPFFRSRKKEQGLSRQGIYELVKKYARKARITKNVSPHVIRHSFATHLIRNDVNLVVLRDLLGHRQISSTQIYLHMTAEDIRKAIDRHPIQKLAIHIKNMFPKIKLPFQYPPGQRFAFNG